MELVEDDGVEKANFADLADLTEHGVLWYLNRVAFHPRGLALAISTGGTFELWTDDEPWSFTPEIDKAKSEAFERLVRQVQGYEEAPSE